VAFVDFTLTPDALEEQLLGLVMAAEQPELRLARQKVVQELANNKSELQSIEERILSTLSASQGNLLEDEAAVDILDTSRALSLKLAQRQQDAQQTLTEIRLYKLKHKPLVRDASAGYKTLTWLPSLGKTYYFSHSWFLQLFSSSVKHRYKLGTCQLEVITLSFLSYKMGLPEKLAEEFLHRLCEFVGEALFRKHHFNFMFHLSFELILYLK
jgi:dynein heavy chain, axonemal